MWNVRNWQSGEGLRRSVWPAIGACMVIAFLPQAARSEVRIAQPPKFFSSATHLDVVFLCDGRPSAVVARQVTREKVEVTILGASLSRSASGLFPAGLKPPPGVPRVRSVRVFPASSSDVAAAIRVEDPIASVEALTLSEPARVVIRLVGPMPSEVEERDRAGSKRKERVAAEKSPLETTARPSAGAKRGPERVAQPQKAPSGAQAATDAHFRSRGGVIPVAFGGGGKGNAAGPPEPQVRSDPARKASPQAAPSPAPVAERKKSGHGSEPKVDEPRGAKEAFVEAPAASSETPPPAASPDRKGAGEKLAEQPDSFPYRISRVAGVAFLWPSLDSPLYQIDEGAKRLAQELEGVVSENREAKPPAVDPAVAQTPAALYLGADLDLVRAAPTGHLLDTVAMYRRALRAAPGWPDAPRVLANIANCYVAIGFDAEALGAVREIAKRSGSDPVKSYALAVGAAIEVGGGHRKNARQLLRQLGEDKESTERCFGEVIRGYLTVGGKNREAAKRILERLEAFCPAVVREEAAVALLRARLHLQAGEPARTRELLEGMEGQLASPRERRQIAWGLVAAREETGDLAGAEQKLGEIAAGRFGATAAGRAKLELAEYRARAGKADEALALLAAVYVERGGSLGRAAARKAAKIMGKIGREDEVARDLLKLGQAPKSAIALGEVANARPLSAYGLESAFRKGSYRQVVEAYAVALSKGGARPLAPEERWMVGKSYLELGLEEEGARVLRDALAGATGQLRVRILKDLVAAVLGEGSYEEADRLADEMLGQQLEAGEASWARLAKAKAAAALGREDLASGSLEKALSGASGEVEAEVQLELAHLLKTRDPRRAREMATRAGAHRLSGQRGREIAVRAAIVEAEAARRIGDFLGAAQALERVSESVEDPELAAYLRFRQASLLEEAGAAPGARELYAKASGTSQPLLRRLASGAKEYLELRERARAFGY